MGKSRICSPGQIPSARLRVSCLELLPTEPKAQHSRPRPGRVLQSALSRDGLCGQGRQPGLRPGLDGSRGARRAQACPGVQREGKARAVGSACGGLAWRLARGPREVLGFGLGHHGIEEGP